MGGKPGLGPALEDGVKGQVQEYFPPQSLPVPAQQLSTACGKTSFYSASSTHLGLQEGIPALGQLVPNENMQPAFHVSGLGDSRVVSRTLSTRQAEMMGGPKAENLKKSPGPGRLFVLAICCLPATHSQ